MTQSRTTRPTQTPRGGRRDPAGPSGEDRRAVAGPPGNDPPTSFQAAAYVQDMSLVLRNIANDAGLDFLAYLLDMAAEEAEVQKRAHAEPGQAA